MGNLTLNYSVPVVLVSIHWSNDDAKFPIRPNLFFVVLPSATNPKMWKIDKNVSFVGKK